MAKAKPALEPISIQPRVNPASGLVTVTVFDGTRQPMPRSTEILLTVHDGAQNQLFRDPIDGSSVTLELPYHNNFSDNYSIVVSADGYEQAGYQPIKAAPNAPVRLELMLLPKNGTYHFGQARWVDISGKKPLLATIFTASVAGSAGDAYASLIEMHPDHLACLLNITTAMQQISLPQKSPLDYFKTFDLNALASDRIFGYADAALVEQVRAAALHGGFETQPAADLALHGDATSSFKQIDFGEANLQLTFHEKNRRTIEGIDCIYVEPDIDYYRDPGAHFFLEVVPNKLTGGVSSPRVVYVLRWVAGRRARVPEFDPLYTIE